MRSIVLILWLLSPLCWQSARAETITVYTSANVAPLMIEGRRGIYPDAIDYLNRQPGSGLSFRLAYLPRKRLQRLLEDGTLDGIVIGLMPVWVDDAAQRRYLWTEPFSSDRFLLVSPRTRPLHPDAPAALYGKSIGLILGYVYPGIEQWIARNGLLRQDAMSEDINLEKLRRGRIDCVGVSESVLRYFIKRHGLQDQFSVAALPGQPTERRFLVPPARRALYRQLAPLVQRMQADPAWQARLARYR